MRWPIAAVQSARKNFILTSHGTPKTESAQNVELKHRGRFAFPAIVFAYNPPAPKLNTVGPGPIGQLWQLERRGYPLSLDLVLANSAASSFISGMLLDDSENPAYVQVGYGQLAVGYGFS
jgi:hypothetical protein